MARFNREIAASASQAQQRAADPAVTVFVEANAGSGKTRVLVDRVVNILLTGTAPDRILCVTYTKAAASEMKDRLFGRLGKWSVLDDEALRADLTELGQQELDARSLAAARRLFARALETPGGLKIQTIHAFCENLLRRFPLEAGALPGFETLDDGEARELSARAQAGAASALVTADIDIILATGGADAFAELADWARSNRARVRQVAQGGAEVVIERTRLALDVKPDETLASCAQEAWEATPVELVREAAIALETSSAKDQKQAAKLRAALSAPYARAAIEAYLGYFLTQKGDLAKDLTTAALAKTHTWLDRLYGGEKRGYGTEVDRMLAVRDRMRAISLAEASAAAARYTTGYLDALDAEMRRRRALDFDDLIRLAGDLLKPENAFSGWVGYKLDGMLTHALVDEAQDTSPQQWDMLRGLTAEFFAGEGAREDERTLFVVGDEKQSIYSFQGADPAIFVNEGDRIEELTRATDQAFRRPGLNVSFRSAPEILRAVDIAFEVPAAAPETKFVARPFSRYQSHLAAREGTPGCVEIWPAIPKPEIVEETSIFDPVDSSAKGTSRDLLAARIADEIHALLKRGDGVWQEDKGGFRLRAARPGDIGILVAKRTGGFVEELIRRLKLLGVPVAGADRMLLREQTAIKDLLALGRFAINPADDLALAEVLKSPFFEAAKDPASRLGDEDLFVLSRDHRSERRGWLWRALMRSEAPRLAEARAALLDWRNRSDSVGLYELYASFLNARSATGETRWVRMFARLSEEARDAVEEFLNRALEFDQGEGGSLAKFIARIAADETAIKREQDSGHDQVQIMTVHASKGLERPIIILPDTTRSPLSARGSRVFAGSGGELFWSRKKDQDPDLVKGLREGQDALRLAEHKRLLYVALTRARDRLIVCGWKQGHGSAGQIASDSWYELLDQRWQGEDWVEFEQHPDDASPARRYGPAPQVAEREQRTEHASEDLPAWCFTDAPSESAAFSSATPSSLLAEGEDDPEIYSPLGEDRSWRFRRGEVIHKLLETLPDLPREAHRTAAERYAEAQTDLDEDTRRVLVEETLGILDHAEFGALFGPGSRAEVSLTGVVGGQIVRGQIDRLLVTDHDVLIIDYKTNRPPPKAVDDVARVYLGQMASYRNLLREIYAGKRVRCALLWTDSADLMELPDALLDTVLPGQTA
ncbi:double-strand break repair helicase AddA [Maricaulis sp.]|uniref:double-strand break repair helicase AddA n=1 Tax=Maricaulis sp. TaxID=1486257 RepID=UPI001B25740C|nr:double-strand break repair helicase AddA [Maricaulis sp.]MBO6796037.1 double-strand break repair helicase AddA [Maricaulis sp.]